MKTIRKFFAYILAMFALAILLPIGALGALYVKITGQNKKHWLNRP